MGEENEKEAKGNCGFRTAEEESRKNAETKAAVATHKA